MPRRLALLPLLLVAACSGSSGSNARFSQPAVSAFAPGPCTAVAPAVLSIGKDAHNLLSAKIPSAATSDSLKANQLLVNAVQPSLAAELAPAFKALVIQIGVVRLRTDTGSYEPAIGKQLMVTYDDVIKACTGSSGKKKN